MKTKAGKGISRRVLTMLLALIMVFSSLSGALTVSAFAEEETPAPVEEPLAEITGEESEEAPTVEAEPLEEPEPAEELEPAEEGDSEPEWELPDDSEITEPEEETGLYPLDVSFIVSNEAELTLKTEENVIEETVNPALRFWNSEESEKYADFALSFGEDEEIALAISVYDTLTGESGVSFAQKTEVKLGGESVATGEYTLYLLKDGAFAEAAKGSGTLSFAAEELSLLVVTKKIEEEPAEEEPSETADPEEIHVYDQLVEVEASDDEPLLQLNELSDATLAALGLDKTPVVPLNTTVRKMLRAPIRGVAGLNDVDDNDDGNEDPTDPTDPEEEEEEELIPWKSDTMAIEALKIEWKPDSYDAVIDPIYLDLVCADDSVPDQKFQIDLSISGNEVIQPGAIEIIFPAYLWHNRYDSEPGYLYVSVPEEPEHGAEYAWRRVGDSIIVTNTHMMTGTIRAVIQVSFRDIEAHEMVDGTDSRTFNDFFNVQTNLTIDSGRTLTRIGNQHFDDDGEPVTTTEFVYDDDGEQVFDEDGEPVTVEKYVYTPIYATIDTRASAKSISKSALNPYIKKRILCVLYNKRRGRSRGNTRGIPSGRSR